nr:E-beta-farnesene synthase [Tanacetum cinerariifolium]
MADVNLNVNAPAEQAPTMAPPTRTDDQILPRSKEKATLIWMWKSHRAIQSTRLLVTARYIYQLDDQWFDLTKDTLKDTLQITPANNNNPFSSPPTSDALINFVNNLCYPKVVIILSAVVTNDMFQPWRALTTIINLSLTGKTLGPDSSLHLHYEEYILGYLKFSAKGTKREVFGMPIPNKLIIADIRGEQYYKEYLEKVAKHQRYLFGEEWSDPDSPAPKPDKATKKSKPSAPKAAPVTKPAVAKASESTSSQQPKPKPAPVSGRNLKSVHDAHRGPLPPMVFKEPNSAKFQLLPEVQGKGKEKVSNEQVALDLLTLQTPKKVSHAEQYIFQRRTPALTEPSGHAESPSIYAKLGLTNNDIEFDEEVPLVFKIGDQDEGQVGPNPGVQIEGLAGSNPGNDAEPQPQSSPVLHAGPNLEHMDLEATDENLKLTVEEQVILEEPASSIGTLSSLQHLAKDFSFGDQFFNDKPSEAKNEKTTAETKAESMVSIWNFKISWIISVASSSSISIHQPEPSVSSIPKDLHMDDDTAPDEQVHSSDDEDIGNARIPKYQMEECHKLLTNSVDESIIRYNVSKPLPLGGPPGQVTIQSDFFFNKDMEYLRYGSKGGRPALSVLKMKVTYYLDVGLEKIVPDQMWIQEECKYDIAAIAVRTHMRILSVVRIEVFSMYGYDYMKKIVLCREDLNEHIIVERDFKYLYLSDFKDLHLVIRQCVEDFQLGIKSNQTQLNLTKPQWDAIGFEYKHDFIVIDSLRPITFRDKYGVQMIMRFNEIHKFSNGTLHQIDEAWDYWVKEFKVNRMNSGLNIRFWTRKDVDRSKEFMNSIQKRLQTRRIFRNLESLVGERVREGNYRLLQRTE